MKLKAEINSVHEFLTEINSVHRITPLNWQKTCNVKEDEGSKMENFTGD